MGNAASRQAELTSESIEAFYASRAYKEAKLRANNRHHTDNSIEEEEALSLGDDQDSAISPLQPADAEGNAVPPNTSNSNSSRSPPSDRRIKYSIKDSRHAEFLRSSASSSYAGHVMLHIKRTVRAWHKRSAEAFNSAIKVLRKIDYTMVAKAACEWIKQHPWETAAIVIPLILLACTPAFLAAAGFTASGIAAGSVAAGIQAGMGSVAAGSTFAILTSAAMGGYGVPIVFGTVWSISSVVGWGICAWKNYRNGEDGEGHGGGHGGGGGGEDLVGVSRLDEDSDQG